MSVRTKKETCIRSSILFEAETMSMTKKDEEDISRAERKVLKVIVGPKKVSENEYRRRNKRTI